MTNHNAYYLKRVGVTEYWSNIETMYANVISISEITGIGDFGNSKNILFEEFNDSNIVSVLAPTETVAYEPKDVSIKLLIEGNSTNKPTMTASNLQSYVSKGIYFKDTFRQLGNILYLQDTTVNSSPINLIANSRSANEYCLLNMKFKKQYVIDIPICNSILFGYIDPTSTTAEPYCQVLISNNPIGFIENGFYYKRKVDSVWIKVVVNTTLTYTDIEKTITGLTASTIYQIKAYWLNVLEEYQSSVSEFTTLA